MCTKFEHNRRLFRGLPSQMSSWNLAFSTFSRTFSHLSPTVFKQTTPNLTYIQFYMSSNYVPNLAKKKFDFGVTHSQKPPSTEQKTQSITIDIDFNHQFIDTQQVAQQFKFQLKQLSLANWLSFGDCLCAYMPMSENFQRLWSCTSVEKALYQINTLLLLWNHCQLAFRQLNHSSYYKLHSFKFSFIQI